MTPRIFYFNYFLIERQTISRNPLKSLFIASLLASSSGITNVTAQEHNNTIVELDHYKKFPLPPPDLSERKLIVEEAQTHKINGNIILHDPSIVQLNNGIFIIYSSHNGLEARISSNLFDWKSAGFAFSQGVPWARGLTKDWNELWAPDMSRHGGLYWLYYAVPVKNRRKTAIIGLATSTTGMPDSWHDQGEVKVSKSMGF